MARTRPSTEQPPAAPPAEGAPPEGQEAPAAKAPEAAPALKDNPRLGQVVHYHLPEASRRPGKARAAIVTRVVNRSGTVNLHVLLNGDEYPPAEYPGHNWLRADVEYDPTGSPDSWRFAEER